MRFALFLFRCQLNRKKKTNQNLHEIQKCSRILNGQIMLLSDLVPIFTLLIRTNLYEKVHSDNEFRNSSFFFFSFVAVRF